MDQIKSYELKRLHMAANRGDVLDNNQDLLDQIRDLGVEVDSLTAKLKKERATTRRLRKELKGK
jgi:hypothetical protein